LESAYTSAKGIRSGSAVQGNQVWICSPDPDFASGLLQKFNGDFLVQGYIYDRIFMKIRSVFTSQFVKKDAISRNVKGSFEKSWIQIRMQETSKI